MCPILAPRFYSPRDIQACRNIFCTATLDDSKKLQRREDGCIKGLRACVADFGRTVSLPAAGTQLPILEPYRQPLRDQPPEVVRRQVHHARSDVWSFGTTMWSLVSSRPLTPRDRWA